MPAESETHGGKQPVAEAMFASRPEARVQRGGQHLRRRRLLDRRFDGPAALAGILDEAGIAVELRILGERCGG